MEFVDGSGKYAYKKKRHICFIFCSLLFILAFLNLTTWCFYSQIIRVQVVIDVCQYVLSEQRHTVFDELCLK